MSLTYRVDWKHFRAKNQYTSEIVTFNDERHFDNWLSYWNRNEKYRKIIGYERHYEEIKDFTANDLQLAFNAGKKGDMSFEKFVSVTYKQEL